MSLTHLHLLLNHFPVIGTVIVTALFAWAVIRRSGEITRVSLGLIAAIGAISLLVFFTGEPAEEAIENLPGFSEAITERHEEFALIATVVVAGFGAVAAATLALLRKREIPRWVAVGSLVMSIVASGVMGYTAMLGGQIRHTEVRANVALDQTSQENPD
jgi:glucan phosphoethanolaminetransferase (alkaline phosphatase superfamily)